MTFLPRLATAALIACIGLFQPAFAEEMTEDQIKALALEAILENPEIIMQAVELLQAREQEQANAAAAAALEANRPLLEQDPNAPILGNPDGDVTIVEFFDYNCPYCRRVGAEVKTALELDGNIRVVYREWPILGPASVLAAQAALASRNQGLYEAFHEAMMGKQGRLSEDSIMATASEVGLDVEQLKADMEAPEVAAHIATSNQLAQTFGFTGTPAFVIGDTLVPGLVESTQILEIVDETRMAN